MPINPLIALSNTRTGGGNDVFSAYDAGKQSAEASAMNREKILQAQQATQEGAQRLQFSNALINAAGINQPAQAMRQPVAEPTSEDRAVLIQENFSKLPEREKTRLTSVLDAGAALSPLIEADDQQGTIKALQERKKELGARIAKGEDIHTEDTDAGLQQAKTDWQGFKQTYANLIEVGQMLGYYKAPKDIKGEKTAFIQNAEAYKNASPEDRAIMEKVNKLNEKGLVTDPTTGKIVNQPGLTDAKKELKYSETSGAEQAKIDTAEELERKKVKGQSLPATIAKEQDNLIDEISIGTGIIVDLGGFISKIDSGELNLNVIGNIADKAKNKLSLSTEESANLASFDSYISKLRNDSLRLNKGTQTEGDATRAMDEIITSKTDPRIVRQRLVEVQKLNERALEVKNLRLQLLRAEYQKEPLDVSMSKETPFKNTKQTPAEKAAALLPPEENIPTGGNIGANTNQAPSGIKFLGFE